MSDRPTGADCWKSKTHCEFGRICLDTAPQLHSVSARLKYWRPAPAFLLPVAIVTKSGFMPLMPVHPLFRGEPTKKCHAARARYFAKTALILSKVKRKSLCACDL